MTAYVMRARENYPPDYVAQFALNTAPFATQLTYQDTPGATFDFNRRALRYNATADDEGFSTNPTGAALWSGQNYIPVGGTVDNNNQLNLVICEKDADTGAVNWFTCHNPANKVPSGIQGLVSYDIVGGSGYVSGTYLGVPLTGGTGTGATACITVRTGGAGDVISVSQVTGCTGYTTGDVLSASNTHLGGSGSGFQINTTVFSPVSDGTWQRFVESSYPSQPMLVDPRTGNVWNHVNSFDGNAVCTAYLFRLSDNYSQVISPLLPVFDDTHMEPIGISDQWTYVKEETRGANVVNHIALTPRIIDSTEIAHDYLLTYAYYDFPSIFDNMNIVNGFCFTQGQTSYFMYSFWPGPSSSGSPRNYELYRFDEPSSAPFGGPVVGGGFTNITPWSSSTGPNTNASGYVVNNPIPTTGTYIVQNELDYYLPATNQLVLISKFMSWQQSGASQDPTQTFFDCTYHDIAGATFDYHHAFVTGYMSAAWAPTSSGSAAYVVIDALEINQFLKQNTYVFAGVDYTKRWFAFVVQPYSGGAFSIDQTDWHMVFVQYQFTYGSPPAVLQVIDEGGWDAAYAAYGTAIGNANVVWQSVGSNRKGELNDSGLYDQVRNTFWFGGDNSNMFQLESAFTPRETNVNAISPPFLRLSFGGEPSVQGQIF